MNDAPMTDRELLELAAKAIGLKVFWGHPSSDVFRHDRLYIDEPNPDKPCYQWNPLADDGDALRLAVRLGILLRTDFIKLLGDLLASGMDHRYATRLAIVRMAAEIGQLKKENSND